MPLAAAIKLVCTALAIRTSFPKTVFELMGKNENSATYALDWTLEQNPCLAAVLAERLAGCPPTSTAHRLRTSCGVRCAV